jgi:hypothetical protein
MHRQTLDYPVSKVMIIRVLQKHQIFISKFEPCDRLSWSASSGRFPPTRICLRTAWQQAPEKAARFGAFPQHVEKLWETFLLFGTETGEDAERSWLTLGNKLKGG